MRVKAGRSAALFTSGASATRTGAARPSPALIAAVLLANGVACPASTATRAVDLLASYGDAYVEHDSVLDEWTIGNDAIRYTIDIGRDRTLRLGGLRTAAFSESATRRNEPDAVADLGDQIVRLGDPGSGFMVDRAEAARGTHFVSLAVRMVAPRRGLAATRYYVVYLRAAAVEMWTTFESLDTDTHIVRNLNAYDVNVLTGAVQFLSGLDTPESDGGPYRRRERVLADGELLQLGSSTLSSLAALPYFSVADGRQRLFSGMIWSGSWVATLRRYGDSLDAAIGLPAMSALVRPGKPVEGPHAFIGLTWDFPGADTAAVSDFVRQSRAGRAFPAWTTFNTWFVHGINVDEETVQREMDVAARVGVELYQLDAGWYPRREPQHAFDFTNGLGSWEVDTARFPSGLARLAEYARAQGLKFGLWVEPERVSLEMTGGPMLAQESFLARQDDAYDPSVPDGEAKDAQVCLAFPAAREWVQQRLFALLDEVRPDNLKWDFNRWVQCTRTDHGHSADGGNYEHTRALYEILAAVRARYPDMTIENCSGGGHRLDFAMVRLTDTAWMDDRSAPSAHVRRNLNGLLQVFPAPYLMSYVMGDSDEPMREAADLPLLVRSRLPGVVGVATDFWQLTERDLNVLNQEIELAKRLRPLHAEAVTYALTPQRPGVGDWWEVIEQVVPDSGSIFVFAVNGPGAAPIRVDLRGVRPDVTYELRSADRGSMDVLPGAELIARGLLLEEAPESAAQVLVLEPASAGTLRQSIFLRRPQ
jgi:alpha-galactosidase